MNRRSSFQLLPLVLLFVIGIEDTSGSDSYGVGELFNPAAKKVMRNLQQFRENFVNAIEQLSIHLKEDNHVLTEYKKYLEAYKLSKDTLCKHGDPPGENDKEEVIDVFVDICMRSRSLPLVELAMVDRKLIEAMGRVKGIDETLKDIIESCRNNPTTCEEQKEKGLGDLGNVFAPTELDNIQLSGEKVLMNTAKQLEECFADETGGLMKELVDAVKEIHDCMNRFYD